MRCERATGLARFQRDVSTVCGWPVQARPFVLLLACALGLSLGSVALMGSRADAAAKPLRCDFDGDGKSDLAAGVPGDNKGRGAVNVQTHPGAPGKGPTSWLGQPAGPKQQRNRLAPPCLRT
jgi:hypothetical protein